MQMRNMLQKYSRGTYEANDVRMVEVAEQLQFLDVH